MNYEWTLFDLNQNVIGSGPKTAGDLTADQASEAMVQMLNQDYHPTTLGGFLLANRWKTNNTEELVAYTDTMRRHSVNSVAPDVDPVDCGANYDGKVRTILLSVAAGLVSAAAGTPVAVHSGDRIPTKHGATYGTVLNELGVQTEVTPEQSARLLDETGFGYYYQPAFNPKLDNVLDDRNQLGLRTLFNTVETFMNPADATVHLGSFYHLSYAKKTVDTMTESEEQQVERVFMFQGLEGYDDIRPGYTKAAEWREGELHESEIETPDYGLDLEEEDFEVEEVTSESARVTEDVISGERDGPFFRATALNAALRIYAGGGEDSIEDGFETALDVLEDGGARDVLDQLRSFSSHGSESNPNDL